MHYRTGGCKRVSAGLLVAVWGRVHKQGIGVERGGGSRGVVEKQAGFRYHDTVLVQSASVKKTQPATSMHRDLHAA
jgi:hypothetical protein